MNTRRRPDEAPGSPHDPLWSLKITEESQEYAVDILELTRDSFRIRMHNPGEPVVIRFAPAEQSPDGTY
jgi:hypothetical protein